MREEKLKDEKRLQAQPVLIKHSLYYTTEPLSSRKERWPPDRLV